MNVLEAPKRREVTPERFVENVRYINRRFGLNLTERTHQMVADGALATDGALDPAHTLGHINGIAEDTGLMLAMTQQTGFKEMIDWDIYWRALSWHDVPVAHMKPGIWNLAKAQLFESFIAHKPALRYMREHRFPKDEQDEVARVIMLHPYDPFHRVRLRYTHGKLKKTTPTELLITDLDSLEVLNPKRVHEILELIRQSFHLKDVQFAYPFLRRLYKRLNNFTYHFDWVRSQASYRRAVVLDYIERL